MKSGSCVKQSGVMVVDLLAPGPSVTISLLANIGTTDVHIHFVYNTKESTRTLQL